MSGSSVKGVGDADVAAVEGDGFGSAIAGGGSLIGVPAVFGGGIGFCPVAIEAESAHVSPMVVFIRVFAPSRRITCTLVPAGNVMLPICFPWAMMGMLVGVMRVPSSVANSIDWRAMSTIPVTIAGFVKVAMDCFLGCLGFSACRLRSKPRKGKGSVPRIVAFLKKRPGCENRGQGAYSCICKQQ